VCAFLAFFCGFNRIESPIMAKASLAWVIRVEGVDSAVVLATNLITVRPFGAWRSYPVC
jgi:hypothetical protein